MTQNSKVDFSDFETEHIQQIKENENNSVYEHLSYKQKFGKFLAVSISKVLTNFMTKRSWQLGLIIYLLIVCSVGTFTSIKFIINLFF